MTATRNTIVRVLDFMGRRGTLILAAGTFIGLAWPALAAVLRPALTPIIFGGMVVSMLRIDWPRVGLHARSPGTALALAWMLGGAPLVMAAMVAVLPLPAPLQTAVLLKSMSAPVLAAVAYAFLLGLDATLALVVAVAATLLIPFTLPPMALLVLGLDLHIAVLPFVLRLVALVGGAMAVAVAIRRVIGKAHLTARGTVVDGANVALYLAFAVAIMDGVAATFATRPGYVLLVTVVSFGANLLLQAAALGLFWRLGRGRAATLAMLSGNRNLAILLAVLGDAADYDVLIYFALGQLPIFLLPVLLGPVYRRITARA